MQASLSSFLLKFLGLLPLPLSRLLATIAAKLIVLRASSQLYFVTERNLRLSNFYRDEIQHKQLVNDSIISALQTGFELPIIWNRSNQWLHKKIHVIENKTLIEQAIKKQRGVIILCPHVGNWEVLGRLLPEFAPTTNLYQPPKQQYLEPIVRQGRENSGAELVPTSQRGLSKILKALKKGEITGILPDQTPDDGSGLYAPFFGVPAYTMTLIHKLATKTNAEVILGYAIRYKDGFKIIFKSTSNEIKSDDPLESVVALSKTIEASLEEDPAQYQWSYKRYKKQPDDFAFYQKALSKEDLLRFK